MLCFKRMEKNEIERTAKAKKTNKQKIVVEILFKRAEKMKLNELQKQKLER